MLVLTRKELESLQIFDSNGEHLATVSITQVQRGRRVRIGIEADPKKITVLRTELVKQEPQAAS